MQKVILMLFYLFAQRNIANFVAETTINKGFCLVLK